MSSCHPAPGHASPMSCLQPMPARYSVPASPLINALRNSGARPPDLIAVLGLGGLGHLGVQFAAKMGFRTVAIARGNDEESLASRLDAHHYINNQTQDAAGELRKLGGAKVILATAPSSEA